jgi:hypothetical protein
VRNLFRIALAVTMIAAAATLAGCSPQAMEQARDREIAEEVDAKVLNDPNYTRSVHYLRDHFPDDYNRLRSGIIARVRDDRSNKEISTFAFWSLRRTMVAHSLDFMAARSPALAQYRTAQIALFEALQAQSAEICAYAASPNGPRTDLRPDADAQRAGDGILYAQLAAMVDGQTAKIHHPKPTPAVYRAAALAMLRMGMTRADLTAISSEQSFNALPDADKCRAAVVELKAINSLPAAQADLLTVEQYRLTSAAQANSLNSAPKDMIAE